MISGRPDRCQDTPAKAGEREPSSVCPARFRKKPVVIEAIQWAGENFDDVIAFGREMVRIRKDGRVAIDTLEGEMTASPGDWIIRGVKGELYPIKPDIFAETYEPVGTGVVPDELTLVPLGMDPVSFAERYRAALAEREGRA